MFTTSGKRGGFALEDEAASDEKNTLRCRPPNSTILRHISLRMLCIIVAIQFDCRQIVFVAGYFHFTIVAFSKNKLAD